MTDVIAKVEAGGVVAIVRLDDLSAAVPLTEALHRGGINAVEFTFTNRLAGKVIEEVRASAPDGIAIGAGTVLDPETARTAILAGAEFIVTPALNVETIQLCNRYRVPTVIGAFTPTEIITAWQAGADVVKVFPASVGGPRYLKDVMGPFPQVKLIPTGGVSVENVGEFIRSGAVAVALGSNLVDAKTVAAGDWTTIEGRSRAVVAAVKLARESDLR
jgi:2-dehydro-3-deoxyphosphogluconate aldolase/(4S)-4-hydroxy-2-oxoglutarate aldolase